MIVGVVYIELYIPEAGSLKDKRSILSSLKKRIHNKFNVSVAEVGFYDKWQRAALGISAASSDTKHLEAVLGSLESFFEREYRIVTTLWEVRFA